MVTSMKQIKRLIKLANEEELGWASVLIERDPGE